MENVDFTLDFTLDFYKILKINEYYFYKSNKMIRSKLFYNKITRLADFYLNTPTDIKLSKSVSKNNMTMFHDDLMVVMDFLQIKTYNQDLLGIKDFCNVKTSFFEDTFTCVEIYMLNKIDDKHKDWVKSYSDKDVYSIKI